MSIASADLIVNVTGTPGSGTSQWAFSGSATATNAAGTGSGFTNSNTVFAFLDWWTFPGDFFSEQNNNVSTVTGSATISLNGTPVRNIDRVLVDQNTSGDKFAISVDSGALSFGENDVISWSGVLTTNHELNDLDRTPLPQTFSATTFNQGTRAIDLPIQLNIAGASTTVPEPSSVTMLGVAAIAFLTYRRRQRSFHATNRPKQTPV